MTIIEILMIMIFIWLMPISYGYSQNWILIDLMRFLNLDNHHVRSISSSHIPLDATVNTLEINVPLFNKWKIIVIFILSFYSVFFSFFWQKAFEHENNWRIVGREEEKKWNIFTTSWVYELFIIWRLHVWWVHIHKREKLLKKLNISR